MSHDKAKVADYLCSVAQDRVNNILSGVCSACNQAGAWMELGVYEEDETPYGLVDHAGQLLRQASDSSNVIFATYSMEESRNSMGDESKRFVDALYKFAGDGQSDQPRIFKYDIGKTVEELELSPVSSASAQHTLRSVIRKINAESEKKKQTAKFYEVFQQIAREKVYLPSKDLTHLLVFDSKSSEIRFRELLNARTPVGNFIIEGSVDAARLFNLSVKRGTPVFVMQGSGGAADKLALVLKHMHWRKQLDNDGGDVDDDAEEEEETSCLSCLRSCLGISSSGAGTGPASVEPDYQADEERWLDLGSMIKNLHEKYKTNEEDFKRLEQDGHFDQALPKKQIMLAVKKTLVKANALKERFLIAIEHAKEATALDSGQDATLAELHKEFFQLIEEYKLRIQLQFTGTDKGDGGSVGSGAVSKTGSALTENSGVNKKNKQANNPEAVYKEELYKAKEGMAWEIRNKMPFEQWFRDNTAAGNDPPPDHWYLPFEGDEWHCTKKVHPINGNTMPCYEENCLYCGRVKRKERQYLRRLARKDKKWRQLDTKMCCKYIRFWQENNPLDDDMILLNGGKVSVKDPTAELCRVILQNIWEPPVPEAVVAIDLLDADIDYEDVMDNVTAAMSADTLVIEVGEKTAMRRRLLNAWQFIRQLRLNKGYQNKYRHLMQLLIILLTFTSISTGVLSYQTKVSIDSGKVMIHYTQKSVLFINHIQS
jgi:hypothetical protein